ncbi:uncharacterized protein (TIGR02217 family) [Altererythrobacter atlanticus]|uniref:TIGR02217 family protein n=1 Tax=Croceibacterium atlanticum TaxID=1267766 RepID=A0A0F7KXF8_9SPHN|nr:DUF2460 domain-containing protein [Croceibacterium atlanticum]AKH43480.1 hypothetical protein WYH_02450 [Croceibacterium atlanticum]MBB5731812.1 uncharacterized protein (TIGR02217 family) [Croceibacterium atlanticum]
MAFWLARKRDGQQSDHIQRFDPRFWTVDFPRPQMGSVVTTGPDSLRVDLEFHHRDALAGLIWDSVDRIDHPLHAYDTDRDYSRTILRFRWQSSGVLPLDAVNGPTLTAEGRDAAGNARSWFVRLWDYATGTPEDAEIVLPFSHLSGGWEAEGDDPVHPGDIDRMFISLVPPGFTPDDTGLLPERANGWLELSAISCEGERPMLAIGDALLPPHDVRMATAYDDCYNQTPARLLRQLRWLGYRDSVLHYVGMSHFFRLERVGTDLLAAPDGTFCTPAENWHRNFLALAKDAGIDVICSLSYELFARHCPDDWQQRSHDGEPARTGWDPPSALLSPANMQAMGWLKAVAARFTSLLGEAGLPALFQIGEPWWWVMPDGRICLYDDAARAALGGNPVEIADIRAPLGQAQRDLLDNAGVLLAQSTAEIAQVVRDNAVGDPQVHLLVFTPTILDPAMPELRRANLPLGWAWPAFERLQLEDYDWLTAGADALRRGAYDLVQQRLAYPAERQDYLSGFVLSAGDADSFWPLIDGAFEEARRRNVQRLFVWALPQVCRDGYTRLPFVQEDCLQAFDDVLYPLALGRDAGVSPEFSTSIAVTASGHERRNSHWSDARLHFDVGPGIRSEAELGTLIAFFRARRGAARGFRLADPFDCSSHGMNGTPTMSDQWLGRGDGLTATFQLIKHYGEGEDAQMRPITRPRADTILISVDGIAHGDWQLESGGRIRFGTAPSAGAEIRAGFLFDVPVRFEQDRLDITGAAFAAGEAPSVPLIEIREAV